MGTTLPNEVRARLDQHLDAVDAALLPVESSRARRRAVVDDLESQILEMLAARSPRPNLADLEAILAELDPPSAYGNAIPHDSPRAPSIAPSIIAEPTVSPRFSRTAIAGLVCLVLSFFPPLRIFSDPDGASSFVFGILGTVLGWLAMYQIGESRGALRGIYLALFDALFAPVVLAAFFLVAMIVVLVSRLTGGK